MKNYLKALKLKLQYVYYSYYSVPVVLFDTSGRKYYIGAESIRDLSINKRAVTFKATKFGTSLYFIIPISQVDYIGVEDNDPYSYA